MKHLIGQHRVDQCVNVHAHVEVLVVATSEPCTDASEGTIGNENVVKSVHYVVNCLHNVMYMYLPVKIKHGSYPIKPKAVNTVLLDVPSEIGEKEAKHLPLGEIKDL